MNETTEITPVDQLFQSHGRGVRVHPYPEELHIAFSMLPNTEWTKATDLIKSIEEKYQIQVYVNRFRYILKVLCNAGVIRGAKSKGYKRIADLSVTVRELFNGAQNKPFINGARNEIIDTSIDEPQALAYNDAQAAYKIHVFAPGEMKPSHILNARKFEIRTERETLSVL